MRKKQERKKIKKEKKRESSAAGEPRDNATNEDNLVRRQHLCRDLLLIAFSSSEATRKRGDHGDLRTLVYHMWIRSVQHRMYHTNS
ncbi:hypothetical protein B296_00056695 [Ensete ventricosum]|uniref:Uncharacterized protein n=1 Tax=Ensete ventricosum TaxID=4639 RepID=A0A426XU78_ENSVE|nr:hypothetical protein B296_00056695 [Ensete ventricosum]